MLHPVGPLPAVVYWRRRLLALTVLLAVVGGAGWLGRAVTGQHRTATVVAPAAATASRTASAPPSLDRVGTPLGGVLPPVTAAPAAVPADAVPGGPCADTMLRLEVRAPTSVTAREGPTFDLVVTNVSAVPCVRAVDKGLQEIVLVDMAGNRIWGSNDCSPETSPDPRTLSPGEELSFPVLWSGLTSEPTCTAARVAPAPGSYVLRGRLGTLTGPDTPVVLT